MHELLQIPRIIEDVQLYEKIMENGFSITRRKVRFGDANLSLSVKTPGLLDSLYFEEALSRSSELLANEVRVRVKAVGVNFKDYSVALGRVSYNTVGTECSGTVEAVGSACSLHPSARVIAQVLDTYRSVICCDEALVVKIPDTISFVEAAKLPINLVTGYRALIDVSYLCSHDLVLIYAGSGGTV